MASDNRYMKAIYLMIAVVSTGCATAIPYSYNERCSFDHMKPTGVVHGSSYGSAYTYGVGTTTINTQGSSLSCGPPTNPVEACEVAAWREEVSPKADYNENITGKRWITGIGYVFYIVPGVVAKVLYDKQSDAAISESHRIAESEFEKCEKLKNPPTLSKN